MALLKTILIIFGIIVLLVVGAGIYFYNFHVFKTLKICVSNEMKDVKIPCLTNQECKDLTEERIKDIEGYEYLSEDKKQEINNALGIKQKLEKAPDFIKDKVEEILEKAVFCENTCKIKKVYGLGIGGVAEVDECKEDEEEVVMEIRGKEGLGILGFMGESGKI